jgi:nucleoside-diphosphate-sugar epimerase
MKHTILGAGGSIGNCLLDELMSNKENVRLVSRSHRSHEGAESFMADITNYEQTRESIKGSDVVYICAGLKYDYKVWKDSWPKIIDNTIEACKKQKAKLIFFDNVYMYGKVEGMMTEDTPYNPCSRKGEVRAEIARRLEAEMKLGDIKVTIARAADLYGPYATVTSLPFIVVLDKLSKGKKPSWPVNAKVQHSLTYTIDCAKALYILAKKEDSFNQVWHLPTFNPALTGKQFIEIAAKEYNVKSTYNIFPKWLVGILGIFDKTLSELVEMLYQNELSYHFDSTKFINTFGYTPKPYEDGIKETIQFLKNN